MLYFTINLQNRVFEVVAEKKITEKSYIILRALDHFRLPMFLSKY